MQNARIIAALVLTYMLFGILLNSVGTVILQSIATMGQTKASASVLEAFKDLPIAITSFLIASALPRLGFRRAMILGTSAVAAACLAMPLVPVFAMSKLLFAVTGVAFALVKVSVYSTIGLITDGPAKHASLTNLIEGLFMVGVLSGYWLFSAFFHPTDPSSLAWLDVYWVLAFASVGIVILLATTTLDESAAKRPNSALASELTVMFKLAAKPLVLVFVFSAFLYVLIEQAIGTWLPTFNNEILHLPSAMSVQAASLFAAALAIGRLGASAVLIRLDWFKVVTVCVVAMVLLVAVSIPLTRDIDPTADVGWLSAPIAAFLLPLIGLFLAPIYPAINSAMLSALPKPDHAAMTGLLVVFSALGGTTGSFVTGQVFARFDGQTAFSISIVPMVLMLACLAGFRRLRDDKALN